MFDKIIKLLTEHSMISTISMIFICLCLLIIYLIIKVTIEKSGNISERVSGISDIVAIIAIPSIAYQINKVNWTLKKNLNTDNNKKNGNKEDR